MTRTGLSKPVTVALEHGLLRPGMTLFDYGCGRGGDVGRLRAIGYEAWGWDPVHRPGTPKSPADVVNLGFVLNVIERPDERLAVLREAWSLARTALVVAVRPDWEIRQVHGRRYGDGIVTAKGTFQKFFSQEQLRTLLDSTLGVQTVAAAPGIFYAFRDATKAQDFRAHLVRTRPLVPRITLSEARFEQHRELLEPLIAFVEERGRLPLDQELPTASGTHQNFGSIRAAFSLVRRVTGDERWNIARQTAKEDLIVFLALAAFRGRPRMSDLSEGLRADVRALFGSYRQACSEADAVLFSLGDREHLDAHLRSSAIGKLLPEALYVHVAALPKLSPVLRLYEGCARALVGDVPHANVIKLNREHRRVSYLSYPEFDRDPHPALAESLGVDLQALSAKQRDFRGWDNPPILHRKDALVPEDYPGYEKFRRLSQQEMRRGLLDAGTHIGNRDQWEARLAECGVRISGHRLSSITAR
jgi:DNA phosphorothioation-associated putative methyltransferase